MYEVISVPGLNCYRVAGPNIDESFVTELEAQTLAVNLNLAYVAGQKSAFEEIVNDLNPPVNQHVADVASRRFDEPALTCDD